MRITLPLALLGALPLGRPGLRQAALAIALALNTGIACAPAQAHQPLNSSATVTSAATAATAITGTNTGTGTGTHASPAEPPPRLAFNRFFTQPIGPQGLSFSPELLARQGQRVRLVGYMVAREQAQTGRFMLTPLPVRMSEHADGEADDLPPATVTVLLPPDAAQWPVPHQDGLIELTGRLDIGRHEDDDGRVTWLRLVLDAAAP
jgi:hypothetical protein